MKLAPDWKTLIKKAWSMRLMALAAVLSGAEVALPFFAPKTPSGMFAAMSFFAVAGAFVARIVAQKGITHGTDD